MEKQISKHRNLTMKIAAYFLFLISAIALLYFIVMIISLTRKSITEFALLIILVPIIIGVPSFILGRYFIKYSKRSDISELQKEFIVCNIINGIFGLSMGAVAISWTFGNSTSDPLYYPVLIVYSISSLLLITAFIFTLKKKLSPSYRLMIIAGIISIPLGIIPLLLGFRLRKYK